MEMRSRFAFVLFVVEENRSLLRPSSNWTTASTEDHAVQLPVDANVGNVTETPFTVTAYARLLAPLA